MPFNNFCITLHQKGMTSTQVECLTDTIKAVSGYTYKHVPFEMKDSLMTGFDLKLCSTKEHKKLLKADVRFVEGIIKGWMIGSGKLGNVYQAAN